MTENILIAPNLYARVGKRRTQYFTRVGGEYTNLGHDEAQARAKLAVMLELPCIEKTIEAMCAGYLAEQQQMRDKDDPSALVQGTIDDYTICLRTVCDLFGQMSPKLFKASDAARYLKLRRDQGRGVRGNREMAALSSAFNYGLTSGAVEVNPCRGYRRNKERPRTRSVAISELNDFLAHAREKGGSSYLVALIGCCVALTGRRRSEILRLPLSAMSEDGIRCKASKQKAEDPDRNYLIAWSPTLRRLVEEAVAVPRVRSDKQSPIRSIFIFRNLEGQPYTDSGFKCMWNRLMHSYAPGGPKSAEWFRAHDLRALYVSEMLDQERSPNTHKDERTMRTVYDRRKVVKVSPLA